MAILEQLKIMRRPLSKSRRNNLVGVLVHDNLRFLSVPLFFATRADSFCVCGTFDNG